MFRWFKERRKLRQLQIETITYAGAILMKLYDVVDAIPDIKAIVEKTKGLDGAELQKTIVDVLVNLPKFEKIDGE